ncbi:transcriptional regulator, TetR family [Maledivibacter halophilus]|uniref:Transcriptional regulator, TetR family n=2 Tax=Maledivibacter halophilus TaxID=36842 RepID=A0A1T5JSF3_9FIRM|nr:transcriptional regulator, TetR family [Maledivibacter halophilus]
MPKIVDYEKKKEEITEKALKIFVAQGYHYTKFSDIARECNFGRTTLYKYFKNKDEIFQYAIDYIIEVSEEDYKTILEDNKLSHIEKIKKIVNLIVIEYKSNNIILMLIDLWLLFKRENNRMVETMNQYTSKIQNTFKNVLKDGIQDKEIKTINVESMSFVLYALIEVCLLQTCFYDNITIEEHLKNIYIIIDGLKV